MMSSWEWFEARYLITRNVVDAP